MGNTSHISVLTLISAVKVVPVLGPGPGEWAGLSLGQDELTTGQLSFIDLRFHLETSPP